MRSRWTFPRIAAPFPSLEHSRRQLVDVAVAGKVTPLLCKRKRRGDPRLPAVEEAGERRACGGARVRELERHASQETALRELAQLVVIGHRSEERADPLQRRRRLVLQQRSVPRLDGIPVALDHLYDQGLLGVEVAVERPLGHTGRVDDLLHAHAVVAALVDQALARVKERLAHAWVGGTRHASMMTDRLRGLSPAVIKRFERLGIWDARRAPAGGGRPRL